ncbi:putative Short chain isoprenyl diphosphate synthase [groundwater metagenome]|uniref:Putative Short chain isoprenyl diphosphate synthase n=1 Tax=groundwater metagenome TaxID=717931 RepID=A0A098E836_9ZZZZ
MDFLKILEKYQERVFDKLIEEIPQKEPIDHYNILREYPLRKGKYLRPFLVLITYEMFGGKEDAALNTAVAMQLSEEWILIHDDIEDDSDMRRGKPALHKIYGIPVAVNAGDALYLIMMNVLRKNREILGDDMTFEIIDIMYATLERTAAGQYLEIYWTENAKEDFSEDDFYRIAEGKTCIYSITTPMILGARIAGVDMGRLKFIRPFGDAIGKAFQIQDDVLNLIGDEKIYGKEIGGDIREGKLTLIFAHLIRTCTADEKKKVIKIYQKKRTDKTDDDVLYVLNLMKSHKSIEYAKQKSYEFANNAREIFMGATADINNESKDVLVNLIDFIITRKV